MNGKLNNQLSQNSVESANKNAHIYTNPQQHSQPIQLQNNNEYINQLLIAILQHEEKHTKSISDIEGLAIAILIALGLIFGALVVVISNM